jgi:S1/P1 Nuclease
MAMKRTCLAAVLILAFAKMVWAWNGQGHEVVAYIAYQHLDPETRAQVDDLLTENPCYGEWKSTVASLPAGQQSVAIFMLAATWPDAIKLGSYDCKPKPVFASDGPASGHGDIAPTGPEASRNIGYGDTLRHKYWHFVDTPFSADETVTKPAPHPNAVDEILALSTALASDESKDLKSYDLVWVEHLVGDVHQPLHDSTRFTKNHPDGDQGGNLVPICNAPTCSAELHAYWDDILGTASLKSALKLGARLNARSRPTGADIADVHVWVQEGFQLAKTNVYVSPIGDDEPDSAIGIPDENYHNRARQIAESQVVLAGYRLAGLLNGSLENK